MQQKFGLKYDEKRKWETKRVALEIKIGRKRVIKRTRKNKKEKQSIDQSFKKKKWRYVNEKHST